MKKINNFVQLIKTKTENLRTQITSIVSTDSVIDDCSEGETTFKTDWKSIIVITIVGLITEIQTAFIIPLLWPYMQEINPALSELIFGLLRGIWSLGIVISSIISGYISNKLNNFKHVILFGLIISIISCILYLCIDISKNNTLQLIFLILFKLTFGISIGSTSLYRAHISMASSESDRSKAIGISMLAPALSYIIGGLAQVLFSSLKYPGKKFIFNIYINLYTAPILLIFILTILSILLLIFMFNGKMRIPPAEIKINNDEIIEKIDNDNASYDKISVVIMLVTQMVFNLTSLGLNSIVLIFAMAAFEWTSAKSVLYTSLALGSSGVIFIILVITYVLCKIGQKLQPRLAIILGLICFLLFYLITYPYPFISRKMVYKHPVGVPGTHHFNESVSYPNVSNNSLVGCNLDYKWCEHTSVTNDFIYMFTLVIVVSFGVPLISINAPLLYSMILGPIKQGTLQGVYNASGSILNIIGPFLFTLIYQKSGITYLWLGLVIISMLCLISWFIYYKRMISYSEAQVSKLKHRRSTVIESNYINLSRISDINQNNN